MQYHEVFIGLNWSPYYCLLTGTYYRPKQSSDLSRRCRFNTSVTQMVQNIGNTWRAGLNSLLDALEESRTYEPEERVCVESGENQ